MIMDERTKETKRKDSFILDAKSIIDKWRGKESELKELLPAVGKQLQAYIEQIGEAVENYSTFMEQNKDLMVFFRTGIVFCADLDVCGEKVAHFLGCVGGAKMNMEQILLLGSEVTKAKEEIDK